MSKIFIFYYKAFLFCLFFIGCTSKVQQSTPSSELNRFLSEQFNQVVPNELHYFVFVPEGSCKSCVFQTMDYFLKDSLASNVTCIYLPIDKSSMPDSLLKSKLFVNDPVIAINYGFFSSGYVVYKTLNKKIEKEYYPNSLDLKEFFRSEGLLSQK
jgi:hypothetical protein